MNVIEFWDMSSGGGQKLDWRLIYIEADSREDAIDVFMQKFSRVTCSCCGPDYAINWKVMTLHQATGYHRGAEYDKNGQYIRGTGQSLKKFLERSDVLLVRKSDR